jgi:hypothetical protein
MFKLAIVLEILVATFTLSNADAQTQRPPIADALMNEPVSLMDWGIMRADQDIKRAVEELNKAIDDEIAGDPRWRTLGTAGFLEQRDKAIKEYKAINPGDRDLKFFPWNQYYPNPLQLLQFNYKYNFGVAQWSDDQQRIRIRVDVTPSQRGHPNAVVARPILIEDLLTTDRCIDLLHDVKAGLLSLHTTPVQDRTFQMIRVEMGVNVAGCGARLLSHVGVVLPHHFHPSLSSACDGSHDLFLL